jgi:flagellar hook-associated protein 2
MTVDLGSAKTLEQIRTAINGASDNPGVTASIITGDGGQQTLTLTSNETGYEERVRLSYGGSINSSTFNFSTLNSGITDGVNEEDLDAEIVIDNTVTATRGSNSIDDVISGITLNLEHADAGTAYTLDVERDDGQVTENVQSFIDAYNTVLNTLSDLHKPGSEGGAGGALEGDNTVLSIQGRMRELLNTQVDTGGAFTMLAELGVTSDAETGTLSLDSSTFSDALGEDFDAVANVFAKEDEGVAFLMEALADDLTDFEDGLVTTRQEGINDRIDTLEDRKENMEYRLELIEARYQAQFGALDGLLAQMQSTSTALTSQLATLPGGGA